MVKFHKVKYEYMPTEKHKKKNYRDEEGAVLIGPRNVMTCPIKPGRIGKLTSFSGQIPYKEDFYDTKKLMLQKELAYHNSKV